jgi:hypothetical protein
MYVLLFHVFRLTDFKIFGEQEIFIENHFRRVEQAFMPGIYACVCSLDQSGFRLCGKATDSARVPQRLKPRHF